MSKIDYFLGLDMGTSSVGWAVTDPSYHLLRAKGKDLWGIREFDTANTAEQRRIKRVARRRKQRKQVRMGLLRDYFHDEIMKLDPSFYIRLDNSKYHKEDKNDVLKSVNGIFDDENYKDNDYFKEYPTIFHLRKELIENNKKSYDVRLVYLAIENMFKHRGHFLNVGLSSEEDANSSMERALITFFDLVEVIEDVTISNIVLYQDVERILSNRNQSRTEKVRELAQVYHIESKNKTDMEYIRCMCGLKVDGRKMFPNIDGDEKVEICFSEATYDDKSYEIMNRIGEDNFEIILAIKNIYDIGSLAGILKGEEYLSFSRVDEYNKHKEDLRILKKVVKKYCSQEQYDELFRDEKDGSYSAYVNSVNYKKNSCNHIKSRRNAGKRDKADLYKTIQNLLKSANKEDENVKYIYREMETEQFLPKQLSSANGIIPNQVHLKELKKILANACEYLDFLNDEDENGLTVSERICQLFSFQIPYYVGPVTEESAKNGGTGWVVRKEDGPILPWNIKYKIDIAKTSEEFICRMVRRCSYISGQQVLPKESMLYQKFCVLNEINKIKVNGEDISVDLKQKIFYFLRRKGKKVTRNQLCQFLLTEGVIKDSNQLSGVDINLNNALTTYKKFKKIFGDNIKKDSYKIMIDDIVYYCTIYGESKDILCDFLNSKYGNVLTQEDISKILELKFKDWGNLSKEFLLLEGKNYDGEIISIIDALWNTNYNLMELLSHEEFEYKRNLEARQNNQLKMLTEIKAEDLDVYYFSSPVKRMVWQTLQIIREISGIMGTAPKRIFIEMTRTDEEKGDKGRKESRKKQLLDLYKNVHDELHNKSYWNDLIESSDANGKLRSKKLYLYIRQMGRCMYSGRNIDLDRLFDDNLYDIDHIYPRSAVKDNNLDNNMVLVEKKLNQDKLDTYPLDYSIVSNPKVQELWRTLRSYNLINEEKYKRLTCRKEFSEEQRANFIARQLVETSQGTKGVADLLKQLLPKDTVIVYAKASNVSDFRRDKEIIKSRLVNEFHHAHDAYLNIVVGNVYYVKFTQNPRNYIKEYYKDTKKYHYHLNKMFDWDVIRENEIAWIATKEDNPGTIQTIKSVLKRNTALMTRMSYENHGTISKETIHSAKKAKTDLYLPIKSSDERLSDVKKYGGFSDISTAYFVLIEYEKKGKKQRTLESLPVYVANRAHADDKAVEKYFSGLYGDVRIILDKIRIKSLVEINGYRMYLTGKMNGGDYLVCRNANNMILSPDFIKYIYYLEKSVDGRMNDNINESDNMELYNELLRKNKNTLFSNSPKPIADVLDKGKETFTKLEIEKQVVVLLEILKSCSVLAPNTDFSLIDGKKNSNYVSKVISRTNNLKLINQSVSGIYETSIDLLTV